MGDVQYLSTVEGVQFIEGYSVLWRMLSILEDVQYFKGDNTSNVEG